MKPRKPKIVRCTGCNLNYTPEGTWCIGCSEGAHGEDSAAKAVKAR